VFEKPNRSSFTFSFTTPDLLSLLQEYGLALLSGRPLPPDAPTLEGTSPYGVRRLAGEGSLLDLLESTSRRLLSGDGELVDLAPVSYVAHGSTFSLPPLVYTPTLGTVCMSGSVRLRHAPLPPSPPLCGQACVLQALGALTSRLLACRVPKDFDRAVDALAWLLNRLHVAALVSQPAMSAAILKV
jgi:hypothetical protein